MINKINEIIEEKEQCQLKALRLEAENKRLKEVIIKALKDTIIRLKKEYDMLDAIIDIKDAKIKELKAENERLKEEINKLGKKHEDYCNTMYWQMKEQMDKYRSALQEIKKIAEAYHHNKPRLLCNMDKFIEQILQKITKAESEEE